MEKIEPLQHGKFYHIYNRGINGSKLFYEEENYKYFLKLYDKHINPIADTFAYCLMKNHFHLLVKIKEENEIIKQPVKLPHQYFSNLFNAYTKAINKKYNRNSGLFQRTLVDSELYLKNLIIYIHTNPVNHNISSHQTLHAWNSYSDCLSGNSKHIETDYVNNLFGDKDNFKAVHDQKINVIDIENYLEL